MQAAETFLHLLYSWPAQFVLGQRRLEGCSASLHGKILTAISAAFEVTGKVISLLVCSTPEIERPFIRDDLGLEATVDIMGPYVQLGLGLQCISTQS